jgi:hypothetical protein
MVLRFIKIDEIKKIRDSIDNALMFNIGNNDNKTSIK